MKPSWRNALFAAFPILAGLASLALGRDLNWDVRNYHYYNAFAFLENRYRFDIAPAQLQSYFNPLADLPFYILARNLSAPIAGFIMGTLHGLNLSLVLGILSRLGRAQPPRQQLLLGAALVAVSGFAPGFLSVLGGAMTENLTSLLVLGAVLLLVVAVQKQQSGTVASPEIALAGALAGAGFGLKPTVLVFALALILAFIALPNPWHVRARAASIFTLGGLIGALVTGAFMWWPLWVQFGNPFFPLQNHIFKSPWFVTYPINWTNHLPRDLIEFLTYPLIFSLDGKRVSLPPFRDIRFGLLYLAAAAWLLITIVRRLRRQSEPLHEHLERLFDRRAGGFVLLFVAISFVLWLSQSGNYRFVIPLELLVPLSFMLILDRLIKRPPHVFALSAASAALALCLYQPIVWARSPWTSAYFTVDAPSLSAAEDAVVIMLGDDPTSYVIPHWPPSYRFLRADGSLVWGDPDGRFLAEIRRALDGHAGPVYLLYNKDDPDRLSAAELRERGLPADIDFCFDLLVNTNDHLEMCRLAS